MNADDKIRAILRMEADAVDPSPAGWDAIQQGIAARRPRLRWTRGTALAGAATVFLGATVYAAADRSERAVAPTGPGPSVSATATTPDGPATPSPSATAPARPVARGVAPTGAVWPLTTTAEVAGWQRDPESMPALKTSTGAALAFARRYLSLPQATIEGDDAFGESRLTVRDGARNGAVVSFVTVRGLGQGGTAPFSVTRADAGMLTVAAPEPGAVLAGSVRVHGTFEADAQPEIRVRLWGDGPGLAPYATEVSGRATFGPGSFSATLSYDSMPPTGSVVVEVEHDGKVSSVAAVPVSYRQAGGPAVFVADRGGRIGVFSTATGTVVRWLTGSEPGARAYDPELSDDGKTVLYGQSTGTCSSEIRTVPVAGGTPAVLLREQAALRHPSRQGDLLAYTRVNCGEGGEGEQVVVRKGGGVVMEAAGPASGGPVVGTNRVAWVARLEAGAPVVRTFDAARGVTDESYDAPAGCEWRAVAWRGTALAGAASCTWAGGVVETGVFAVGDGEPELLWTLEAANPYALDFAGENVLVGDLPERRLGEPAAYRIVGGYVTRIPGIAARPTWS